MSEPELGNALLAAATPAGPTDPGGLAERILDRDRRRIVLLGGATLLLWLVGVAGIVYVLYNLSVYMPRYVELLTEIEQGGVPMPQRQRIQENYLAGFQIGVAVTAGSVAVLALAALGTFLLVLTTRRATLRQVNASLRLIADRLRQLQELREREAPPRPPV
jgi:hypothetical protein